MHYMSPLNRLNIFLFEIMHHLHRILENQTLSRKYQKNLHHSDRPWTIGLETNYRPITCLTLSKKKETNLMISWGRPWATKILKPSVPLISLIIPTQEIIMRDSTTEKIKTIIFDCFKPKDRISNVRPTISWVSPRACRSMRNWMIR